MRAACVECGRGFEAARKTAKFCGGACRQRAHRRPKGSQSAVVRFVAMTQLELERLGRLDSMLGQQALIVAARMESGAETGGALVTLSKEHSRLMALVAASGGSGDLVDEVARRRDEKRARAAAG